MKTILISGGTGLIGKHLSKKLRERGYHVSHLSRIVRNDSEFSTYYWSPEKNEIDKVAIDKADYIIQLAGANIGERRWSKERRKVIRESRINTAELLFKKSNETFFRLQAFISASAVGYYGATTSDKIFNEKDAPANDFLGETCRLWEEAADKFEQAGIRTVKIRTGIVLTRKGGALGKIVTPIKLGIGSPIGTGYQYVPWIHIDDLTNIYIKAIEDTRMNGAYNAVSPDYITNGEFNKTVAKILKKRFWFPNIPSLLLKIMFGKMSEMLLNGSRVSPDKIINAGYEFKYPELSSALINLLAISEPKSNSNDYSNTEVIQDKSSH